MTYDEALNKIHSLDKFGSKPGLDRVNMLFDLVGNDIKNQEFIHVAGTNGKGSVCMMLSNILKETGLNVGLFVSPYIIDFCERIQINNEYISHNELANTVELLFPYVEDLQRKDIIITEFEFLTVVAFYIFKKKNCDIVILEVGMGGLLDSTNVIDTPLCSVITRIDLDHTNILGNTLAEIATQKCGIIKENGITVTSSQKKEALDVIKSKATKEHNLLLYAEDEDIDDISFSLDCSSFNYKGNTLKLHLLGKHQIENVKVVLSVIFALNNKGYNISIDNIKNGLEKSKNPARFEVISTNPLLVLDGAHNPNGIDSFINNLNQYDKDNKKILVIGMLKDKDIDTSISKLTNIFNLIVVTEVNNPRKESSLVLKEKFESLGENVIEINKPIDAIDYATKQNKDVFVTGSLYLASEIRNYLKKQG